MDKIKVVHVLHSVGGVDVSLRLILENINPSKFQNIVVHGENDTSKEYTDKDEKGIREYKIPIDREIRLFKDIGCILKTRKILKKEKPNLIHAHSAKGGIIARAAALFLKIKVLHTPQAYSFLSSPVGLRRNVFLIIERIFKHFNSILLASSNSELERGIKEVGYNKDNALLFNNAIKPIEVNTNKSSSNLNLNIPDDFICTVGRPSYQKNIEMMVRTIAVLKKSFPDIHLVLMGVGEYSPNIKNVENLIDKYNLESNITMVKWMERENIFNLISKAKLYISTARYEGLPYSIIESLALGKACVVTNSDGNRDLVVDGQNGFVVNNYDENEMAEKIYLLLEDPELRSEFERNSKKIYDEHHNISQRIALLEKIYIDYHTIY